ncbi:cytochrome P450 [Suillus bovinus]|uniref:cytochrome P450 n=1 Tax=Suillus bovinus TaxID=48563 RepID=UPI001B85DCBD|nr:cytochrome P450 [Suillus bovinus]KAG2129201.1 cytochrome P450 [Suillus bovinus]
MVDAPYKSVKDQIAVRVAPVDVFHLKFVENPYFVCRRDGPLKPCGADTVTTVSTIYSLFLAMTLFPDVQKKAQAEIDAVVGTDRLPSFADRESLPYIEALVKKSLRWNVFVPIGMRLSYFCCLNLSCIPISH